jgi:hypothetical protein
MFLMGKRKHIWHCGKCDSTLLVSKKGKKTKYLYCPNCKNLQAYFNFDILGALGSVAKQAIKFIPGIGPIASMAIEGAEAALTPSGSAPQTVSGSASAPILYQKPIRQSPTQKMKDIDELLKR